QVYQPAYPGYWPPTYSSMFALGDTWYRTGLHNLIETSTDEGLTWVDRTPAVPQFNILSVSASAQFALGLLAPMRWAPVEWEDSSHTTGVPSSSVRSFGCRYIDYIGWKRIRDRQGRQSFSHGYLQACIRHPARLTRPI
ncbi:MAG: hypothetical protein WAV84_14860, partial [Bacteroidota bacterium]